MSTNPGDNQPIRRSAPPAAVRQARLTALVVGGLSLLLIGGFVAMIFFAPEVARLNAVGPVAPGPGAERGGLVFQGTVNIWTVRGRMTRDAGRRVRFDLDLVSATSEPAPPSLPIALSLDRPDGSLEPIPLRHRVVAPGSYVAGAELPASGRWRLNIELAPITGVFEFDVTD